MDEEKRRIRFESSVNSEGIETTINTQATRNLFESSVNSEGIETPVVSKETSELFESSVNSEGIETDDNLEVIEYGLRAV